MTYFMSIILGLVQGITEFLPISSSGHLSLIQHFWSLGYEEADHMFFDVLLHLGTLVSVCLVYWREIWDMIREFFLGARDLIQHRGGEQKPPPARRLVLLIIVGTLPLFAILPIKNWVEQLYYNPTFIALALMFTGFLLFFSDRAAKGRKSERSATVTDAVMVGCAQALAVVPGLSRSGSTIAAGLTRGFDRQFAVRFSFLLSLPAVLGANILSIKDAVEVGIEPSLIPIYLVGMLVAMASGYFAIRLVKLLSDRGKFGAFAYYCWAVGGIAFVASYIVK